MGTANAAARNTPQAGAHDDSGPFNIGEAAQRSGVSAKMIRHYEDIGLLPQAARTQSGYRQYAQTDVHNLRFIRTARELGFGIKDIAALLRLWRNRTRASRDVKRIALVQIAELERRIEELQTMKRALERLAHCCRGDERPECPILDGIDDLGAGEKSSARRSATDRLIKSRRPLAKT